MGEELNKLFGGASEIFFAPLGEDKMQKLGDKIFADTTTLSEDEAMEIDRIKVREAMQIEPLKIEPISCSFNLADGQDWETILGIREDNGQPKICSLTISGKPYIHRPKNLKYPNKKRARRIWKKWAKRYGVTPAQSIVFPNVEMSCEMNENGVSYNITAKPITDER